jgi:hypothetical protein
VGWNCSNVQGSVKSKFRYFRPPCSGARCGAFTWRKFLVLWFNRVLHARFWHCFLLLPFGALIYRYRRIISKTLPQTEQPAYNLAPQTLTIIHRLLCCSSSHTAARLPLVVRQVQSPMPSTVTVVRKVKGFGSLTCGLSRRFTTGLPLALKAAV